MRIGQALVYFLAEAVTGLRRSWKVSLLAISTIAVSLFAGGVFILVIGNLARIVGEWRGDARAIVYLVPEASDDEVVRLSRLAEAQPWVERVERVSRQAAEERFAAAFPDLSPLLGGWDEAPLPASLEISYEATAAPGTVRAWLDGVAADASVQMVDDDRRWLDQLGLLIVVARAVGLILGAVLMAAATFTIASVIRLTAYLYREEIRVMRLVGATELFIRGPFLAAGLIQGVLGGGMALAGLSAAYHLGGVPALPTLLGSTLFSSFLSPAELAALVALGGLAGLLGAALPLRRPPFGESVWRTVGPRPTAAERKGTGEFLPGP